MLGVISSSVRRSPCPSLTFLGRRRIVTGIFGHKPAWRVVDHHSTSREPPGLVTGTSRTGGTTTRRMPTLPDRAGSERDRGTSPPRAILGRARAPVAGSLVRGDTVSSWRGPRRRGWRCWGSHPSGTLAKRATDQPRRSVTQCLYPPRRCSVMIGARRFDSS
jgi:hypothetical protein